MEKKKGCIFFDLGQTLINEWKFIDYFDKKLLELLNGFGARIDQRNYRTVRDSAIRDRMIGHGSVKELIIQVCRLTLQPGYEKMVLKRIEPDIMLGRKSMFHISQDALTTVKKLSHSNYQVGIIANQSSDVLSILKESGLDNYIDVKMISSEVKLKKPDPEIFRQAMALADSEPSGCVMVGDRLDTDICPANKLGMRATIRFTDSLFKLQEPAEDCEKPTYAVSRLTEIPELADKIFP